jgi:hypothetical protein
MHSIQKNVLQDNTVAKIGEILIYEFVTTGYLRQYKFLIVFDGKRLSTLIICHEIVQYVPILTA